MFEDLVRAIAELQETVAETRSELAKTRAANERVFRKGKVTDVDAAKQLYRQEVGIDENGKPVKSAWIPYGQIAGALKVHSPPSVGQQMIMVSPDGDFDQAFGLPLTFSKDNASPSTKGDEDVATRGQSKDTTRADYRLIENGGSSIKVEDGKVTITASEIVLEGSVKLGGADADKPAAMQGTIDTGGFADISNLATKVLVK